MRPNLVVVAGCLIVLSSDLPAQQDSVSGVDAKAWVARAWIVPLAIGISAAFDGAAREGALNGHSRSLDKLASLVNPLGTAKKLVPLMAVTYAGALVVRDEPLERGTLETAAGYFAADLVESALKPIVGRERPHASGNSRRFHPFTANGDWHSFPSAHVSHITSIVEAVSLETRSAPVSAIGDLLISLMGWDRVYEDQHWTSDVAATVAISSLVSVATVRWLDSHWARAGAGNKAR
jgi:membrane-associated phospholipid phosphatase